MLLGERASELFGSPGMFRWNEELFLKSPEKEMYRPTSLVSFRDRLAVSFKEGWFVGRMKMYFVCVFFLIAWQFLLKSSKIICFRCISTADCYDKWPHVLLFIYQVLLLDMI